MQSVSTRKLTAMWAFGLCAALILLFQSSAAMPATITANTPATDFDRVDSFIEKAMDERGIPGAAIVVVRGDEIVHVKGFGEADGQGREVTPQTPFRIGSSTKSFTALAIMQLVEEGEIDLQAPVQRYLPYFRLADADASARITVANLLHQTSGIPGEANAAALADSTLTLEENVRELRSVSPDSPVGSTFAYSNVNYDTLGLIIEKVSGQSYASYVGQHILSPLDMRHSFATPTSEGHGDLASGHQWFFGVPFATTDRFIQGQLPAGFISASAEDMGHYLIAQMNEGRYREASLLSPEGISTLHTPGPNTQTPTSPVAGGSGGQYAMGWVDGKVYGVPALWHNGDDSRNGSLMVLSKNDWGMALLVNSSNPLSELEPSAYLYSGVTRLLDGKELAPTTMPSIGNTYLVVNSVLLALSIPVLLSAVRLPWWYLNLRQRLPARRWWRISFTVLRASAEIIVPATIFLAVPWGFYSWELLIFGVPDLGWWLLAASVVTLATGLAHGALLAMELIRPGPGQTAALRSSLSDSRG